MIMENYDAIIIGFGKGGKTLAADLAGRGWKVAIVERSDKMYGGTCINVGCIPTKTLIYDARMAKYRAGDQWQDKAAYYYNAVERKNGVTTVLRKKNYDSLASHENIKIYTGVGSFVSSDEVSVKTNDGEIVLKARYIFINTGAKTVVPPIAGIKGNRFVYDSASIMNLKELPHRLVVIGGGYIGLEFASMYAMFGTEVIVLEGGKELLPREDRDIAEAVVESLNRKGVTFLADVKVNSIDETELNARVSYIDLNSHKEYVIEADAVLVAVGRHPNTDDLFPEIAGIEVDEKGAIVTDEYLRTSNPHVWAMGDVRGGLQFTYISLDDYRIVREGLFGRQERSLSDQYPPVYSVFIDPPLSHVGMNETEALKKGYEIKVNKLSVSAIPRMKISGKSEGLLKAVIDIKTGKVLGCTLFCPESSEIINIVSLAIKSGRDYTFLRDCIYTHPSMSESFNELFK